MPRLSNALILHSKRKCIVCFHNHVAQSTVNDQVLTNQRTELKMSLAETTHTKKWWFLIIQETVTIAKESTQERVYRGRETDVLITDQLEMRNAN